MKLITIIFMTIGFYQCASLKLDKNPPFFIEKATYYHWVGGVPGVSGTNVTFHYTSQNEDIVFEKIYFKSKVTKAEIKEVKNTKFLVGNFSNSTNNDLQLHKDPVKEYGNTLPNNDSKPPLKLEDNEVLISYKVDGKIKYYKVKNLEQKQAPLIPQVR